MNESDPLLSASLVSRGALKKLTDENKNEPVTVADLHVLAAKFGLQLRQEINADFAALLDAREALKAHQLAAQHGDEETFVERVKRQLAQHRQAGFRE